MWMAGAWVCWIGNVLVFVMFVAVIGGLGRDFVGVGDCETLVVMVVAVVRLFFGL